ncbi:DUF4350 domain-containing protein [Flavobacterium mekongense]|uniref:DUF4350 domain-containing protein n=1 Tax=Flavobacterium mekongense TaxID=3379707 RepID=UPI00399A692A
MNRTLKIYIFLLVVLMAGVIYVDAVRPKPVDWSPSYILRDKIPFGLYVFDQESKTILNQRKIEKVRKSAYEFLDENYDYNKEADNYTVKGTLFHVCDTYIIDDESTKEMFYYVSHGNNAFLSVERLPEIFTDSLNIKLDADFNFKSQTNCWMANPNLGQQKYDLSKGGNNTYFSSIDTLTTTILGYQSGKDNKRVNFIKVPYKKGNFFIHLQPTAFTNYHLLKDNHYQYTEKVLSYVPNGNVYWLVNEQEGLTESTSMLRFIRSQPALMYAWYLFLTGIVIFMIFNAKRRQRVIPIIKPLSNTTVDFTKTIGNLYYQEGNHQNLIDKKIIYFLERVRNEYLIDTAVLDENFIKKLHAKTGKDIKDIEHLVYLINYQKKSYHQSIETDLIEINKAIEKIIS